MNNKITLLKNTAENFNITLTDINIEKFILFEKILKEYNSHTNLMSSNDINIVFEKHFTDSLAFGKILSAQNPYKIIDIGSGGGFPIIPIAIILENSKIIAVDSTKKKTDFLNSVAKELDLKNFEALNTRAEDLAHKQTFRNNFDIATARAVGNLNQISELCIPFLKDNGIFIAYKAAKVSEEIESAQNAINQLGAKINQIFEYELNLEENFQRNLVVIQKNSKTPDIYPRSYSTIKNKPL